MPDSLALTHVSPIDQMRAVGVISGGRPERSRSSIALSGPTAVTRRAHRDALAVDAEGCGDFAGVAPVGQVQDDGRSLDMVRRRRARAGECRQCGAGLVS